MTFFEFLGWGLLALVLIYLAARLGSAAWYKSKREHDSIATKRKQA
jgi:hypothetical protein